MIDYVCNDDNTYVGIVFFKCVGFSMLVPPRGERTLGVTAGAYESRIFASIMLWWGEFDFAIGTDLLPKEEENE